MHETSFKTHKYSFQYQISLLKAQPFERILFKFAVVSRWNAIDLFESEYQNNKIKRVNTKQTSKTI